jgi:hypothetical protein
VLEAQFIGDLDGDILAQAVVAARLPPAHYSLTLNSKTRSKIPVVMRPVKTEWTKDAAEIQPNPAMVYR